jgi:hypothetical protein
MGGTESRLLFQKTMTQLLTNTPKINEFDEKFWSTFWILPSSIEEVFSLVNVYDVQKLRCQNPKNYVILLRKVQKHPHTSHLTNCIPPFFILNSELTCFFPAFNVRSIRS